MRKTKKNIISVIVVILVIGGILGAVARCIYNVKGRLNGQIEEQMVEIANQNAIAMDKQVESIHILLNGLAEEFRKDEIKTIRAKIDLMKPYTEIYKFKRLGYIDAEGVAHTTDGYQRTLKNKECFEAGMQGRWYASDRIVDSLGEPTEINIFSVPVYDKEGTTITGVLFATYDSEYFSNMLIQDIFNSKGFCFITKPDGTIVSGYDVTANMGENGLINSLIAAAPDNTAKVQMIIEDMEEDRSGFAKLYYNQNYYVYYMPVASSGEYNAWHMCTVVPASVFMEQFDIVWYDVQRMINVILAGLAVVFAIYFWVMHRQSQQLERLAYEDPLTGGYNYEAFKDKLSDRNLDGGYIVSMDIGDFRIINNICGEKTGDQLLLNVWDILLETIQEGDLAAHINADQFVLYLQTNDENEIVDRIRMTTLEMNELVEILNVPHVLPYFGICALDGFESLEMVYSRASQAKNRVKTRRDENYAFYDDKVFQQTVDNKRLEDGFEDAIANEEFEVWYQPKYDTMSGAIVGAEALVRWRKEGELIPPFRFIPLFEKNGMIATLDEYVFRHVCRQQKYWQQSGKKIIPISINISRASLFFGDIANRYEEILKSYDLSPEYVQLEITESATLENDDIDSLMNKFHSTGFQLLLDDFGNGYSSLATLNTMKFDILKLDKSLIDYIGDNNGEELLRHTVELAKHFGLNITAEGVETKEQVIFLQEIKCDDIQGYYFSRPLPETEFELLLEAA